MWSWVSYVSFRPCSIYLDPRICIGALGSLRYLQNYQWAWERQANHREDLCVSWKRKFLSSQGKNPESNRIWRWATEWLCQESCSAEWNLSLARHAVHMCAHWEGKGYTWWPKEIVLTPGSVQPYNLAVHSPLTHNREKVVFPFSLHSKEGFESIRSLWNQKLLFITVKAANMGDFRLGYHWL